tara:strand:+ start:4277 stop:4639 length:363 start_codon:yes stop_codon:yes gene_type:complete
MSEGVQVTQASTDEGYGTGNWRILMASAGIDMFFMRMATFLVNICTLMIAVPFTTVFYYNAWCQKVTIDGKNLKFTGTAGGFFMTWLKTLGLSVITLSLYWWLVGRKNKARWVDSNLSWA